MKPTAVRANKSDLSSSINNTSSVQSKTVCSTPNKNQSHNASPASANSTQQNVSGAPSITSTSLTSNVTSSNSSSSGVISLQTQSSAAREENQSNANKAISQRDQQPLQNSIIPTTVPVAFAAVAKHSTSQHTANEGNSSSDERLCR